MDQFDRRRRFSIPEIIIPAPAGSSVTFHNGKIANLDSDNDNNLTDPAVHIESRELGLVFDKKICSWDL